MSKKIEELKRKFVFKVWGLKIKRLFKKIRRFVKKINAFEKFKKKLFLIIIKTWNKFWNRYYLNNGNIEWSTSL